MGWGEPFAPTDRELLSRLSFNLHAPGALPQGWDDTIENRFVLFHRANPAVYAELCRLARALAARGHRRLGIGMLWEVLRFQSMLKIDRAGEAYALNNSFRSRYARLIMDQEPDLAGVFETRGLRAA